MLDDLVFHPELVVETEKQSFTSIQPITYSGVIQGELFCYVLFLLVCFWFSDCSVLVFPFIHSLVASFIHPFVRSFIHPFVRSFIYSFILLLLLYLRLILFCYLPGRDLSWTECLYKWHYATVIKYYYVVLNFDLTSLKPLHKRLNSNVFVWITVLQTVYQSYTSARRAYFTGTWAGFHNQGFSISVNC